MTRRFGLAVISHPVILLVDGHLQAVKNRLRFVDFQAVLVGEFDARLPRHVHVTRLFHVELGVAPIARIRRTRYKLTENKNKWQRCSDSTFTARFRGTPARVHLLAHLPFDVVIHCGDAFELFLARRTF